jgi:hypothetical protein
MESWSSEPAQRADDYGAAPMSFATALAELGLMFMYKGIAIAARIPTTKIKRTSSMNVKPFVPFMENRSSSALLVIGTTSVRIK